LDDRIRNLRQHFSARATHNAHVLVSEVTALRNARRQGKLAQFVVDRLGELPLYQKIARDIILRSQDTVPI
jgi:hypothetical protein